MIRTKVRVEDLNFYKQCCDVRKFKIGKVIRIMMTMGIKMIVMMMMLVLMIMKPPFRNISPSLPFQIFQSLVISDSK